MKPHRPRPSPFSIRFSEPEKAFLRARAGGAPLGEFVRSTVLGSAATARKAAQRAPIKDANALGQALAMLGQTRLASNLNQLAKAANFGVIPVGPETEHQLVEACEQVAELRRLLLSALGIQPGAAKEPLRTTFSHAGARQ